MMAEPEQLPAAAVALAPQSEEGVLPDHEEQSPCLALVMGVSARVAWSAIQVGLKLLICNPQCNLLTICRLIKCAPVHWLQQMLAQPESSPHTEPS